MSDVVLQIEGLKTYFHTDDGVVRAVDNVTMSIRRGQTLGVVGESGSGKSVTSLTVMRLLPDHGAEIAGGKVVFLGQDLTTLGQRAMSDVRGKQIGMIFQEPMTSLNPVYRVGEQVMEVVLRHESVSRAEARQRALRLFEEVGIPDPERRLDSYPHEMSGGQKQRVVIAMALACNPALLIADEPTTALDVTIQAQILALLRKLRDERSMSIMFITHDLGVIAELADHVAVMYRGQLVEYGDVLDIFGAPKHPYTKGLLACRPRLDTEYRMLPTVDDFMDTRSDDDGGLVMTEKVLSAERLAFLKTYGRDKLTEGVGEPILSVRDLEVHFPVARNWFGQVTRWVKAVDGISFDVYPGQTLGLVGESGCGKTTTGRAILRLIEPTAGTVRFGNRVRGAPIVGGAVHAGRETVDLRALAAGPMKAVRRNLQIIFQDPYSSLNPRLTVQQAITEPMLVHGVGTSETDRRDRAAALLEEVGLRADYLRRYPHEFSGGQRQRICIARTLALEPEFVICDESVSALDVSVQAQVLNLLKELQLKRQLTYIFISHDLSVVKFMSDVMCVMKDGKIVEAGPSETIYRNPQQAYTRGLIDAIPRDDLDAIERRQRERAAAAPR